MTFRSEIMADRSLKITKIRLTDQGLYVCRAENAAGFIEATANLVVHCTYSFVMHFVLIVLNIEVSV